VFITIKIRNSWKKINNNNTAEKFSFQKNLFYFVVLNQKKHVFKKNICFETSSDH